jgi:hypothetical protein
MAKKAKQYVIGNSGTVQEENAQQVFWQQRFCSYIQGEHKVFAGV